MFRFNALGVNSRQSNNFVYEVKPKTTYFKPLTSLSSWPLWFFQGSLAWSIKYTSTPKEKMSYSTEALVQFPFKNSGAENSVVVKSALEVITSN